MCGFVGIMNLQENLKPKKEVLISMNEELTKRGPDECGYYVDRDILLGHRRLIVIDPDGGKQPMSYWYNGNKYVIAYNGQIYNTKELRSELIDNNFELETYSDTEILLKSYILHRENIVNKLNGIFSFAIWDEKNRSLFLARDHFGVKPLYYTFAGNNFVFASEVKAILKFPGVIPVLDRQGISEMFGIGPAHTNGITAFKNIFEVKPAHFVVYNENGLHSKRYWKLESKPHIDNLEHTCEKVQYLLEDAIKRQLVSDVPLCTFLSGGLDSSIITLYASQYCKEHNLPPLNTYSVDYIDNDKNFQKTDFQPNSDNYYIDLMQKK